MKIAHWSRRPGWTSVALVAAISFVLAGCGGTSEDSGAQDGETNKIRFVMAPNFTALDALVALETGLFDDEGLDVEMTPLFGSPELAQATISGTADISLPGISGLFATVAADRPTIGFGVSASQAAHCVTITKDVADKLADEGITPDSPIEDRVKSLTGLTISTTTAGGSVEQLVRGMMDDFGVKPTSDQFTALKETAGNLAALKIGRIDATVLSPPDSLVPAQDGYGTCFINFAKDEIPSIEGAYYTVYVTSKEFAEANPTALDKWTRAVAAADEMIQNDPEQVAEAVASYFPGVSDTTLVDSVKAVAPAYANGPQIGDEGYQKAVRAYNDSGAPNPIGEDTGLEDVFTTEHAAAASKDVFPK
jgi:NitT/TauT family transport system substrate-binding protein